MIKRYWVSGVSTSTTTSYIPAFNGGRGYTTTENFAIGSIAAAAGTIRNLYARQASVLSGGAAVYTIKINTTTSALTCTIASGQQEASDTTHSVAVARGDRVKIVRSVTGTPTLGDDWIQVEYEPTDATLHVYGAASNASPSTSATNYLTLTGTISDATTIGSVELPVPLSGTITAFNFFLPSTMVASASRTLAFVKNGVVQDGAGGTPDTRLAITTGNSAAQADFSLSITAGDKLGLTTTITGTPTSERIAWGFAIVPTTAGESMAFGRSFQSPTTYPAYSNLTARTTAMPTADTLKTRLFTAEETFETLYMAQSGVVGAGNNYTLTLLQNGSASALLATLTGSNSVPVTVSDTGTVTPAAGDTFSVQYARTLGAVNEGVGWSVKVVSAVAAPPGAITDLSATAISSTQVDLTWTAATDATSHRVERATVP